MTVEVQDVKDAFYGMLRDRIAAGNPARTLVLRGVTRPGVLVVENELPGAAVDGIAPVEAFGLRWTGLRVDMQGAVPLSVLTCEIRYATDGSAGAAGMDRGRALAAMDAELSVAIGGCSNAWTAAVNVSEAVEGAAGAAATGTNVFWGNLRFGAVVLRGERLERSVEMEVFGYGS